MTFKEFKIQNALGTLSYKDKWHLAYNPKTCKGILTILSRDKGTWGIRYRVALNPNTPLKIVKILSTDKNPFIRDVLKHRD